MSKKKTKEKPRIDTFASLEKFVQAVRKKYGSKADEMRVEVHSQFVVNNEEHWGPNELSYLGVANYKEDKINEYPAEKVVVIR
jgi:hypothetical protein